MLKFILGFLAGALFGIILSTIMMIGSDKE